MSNRDDAYNSPSVRAIMDAVRAFKEGSASITDVAAVNRVQTDCAGSGALSGSIGIDRNELLSDVLTTMRHARVFITTREKMHPTGVGLWDELVTKIEQVVL